MTPLQTAILAVVFQLWASVAFGVWQRSFSAGAFVFSGLLLLDLYLKPR